jgi:integrase/recombinase XerC
LGTEHRVSDNTSTVMHEYLSYLESVRGYSARTVDAYGNDLSRYVNYCSNHSIEIENAVPYEVQKYIADLSAERMSATSVNRNLSSIRGFYRWMIRFKNRKDNPCLALKNFTYPSPPTRIFLRKLCRLC